MLPKINNAFSVPLATREPLRSLVWSSFSHRFFFPFGMYNKLHGNVVFTRYFLQRVVTTGEGTDFVYELCRPLQVPEGKFSVFAQLPQTSRSCG